LGHALKVIVKGFPFFDAEVLGFLGKQLTTQDQTQQDSKYMAQFVHRYHMD